MHTHFIVHSFGGRSLSALPPASTFHHIAEIANFCLRVFNILVGSTLHSLNTCGVRCVIARTYHHRDNYKRASTSPPEESIAQ